MASDQGSTSGDRGLEKMVESAKKLVRIKIISMGASETGKSCLIKRFCEKRFVSKYMATLGIDYGVTSICTEDYNVKVNIFDMAGLPFFYEVRNEFYKGANGALLVYDVTDRTSFESLTDWLTEMKNHTHNNADADSTYIVVCANKVDNSSRSVDTHEGRLWAETRGFLYFETSALTGKNVTEMFEALFKGTAKMKASGVKPALNTGYTAEQAAIVMRVRSCSSHQHHEVMGLPQSCTRDEIVKAYKHLAVLLHPDKNSAPGSEEAFKKLTRAKDYMLNNR